MLVLFIWLSMTGSMPDDQRVAYDHCKTYPGNQCILLNETDSQYYFKKYDYMLNIPSWRKYLFSVAQTVDVLRMFYIYQKGGIYSDLDNEIDYECLYQMINQTNMDFFLTHDKDRPLLADNNFFYAKQPYNQQLKYYIEHLRDCYIICYDVWFAGPLYFQRMQAPFINTQKCLHHKQVGLWYRKFSFAAAKKFVFFFIVLVILILTIRTIYKGCKFVIKKIKERRSKQQGQKFYDEVQLQTVQTDQRHQDE